MCIYTYINIFSTWWDQIIHLKKKETHKYIDIHIYIHTGEEEPTIGPCLKSVGFCEGGARPRESDGSPQQQDVPHL